MSDLIIQNIEQSLALATPQYKGMLQNIEQRLPSIVKDTSNFHKTHSQFMSAVLDATAITPMRSLYTILAEIEQTRLALQESYIKIRKQQVSIKRKTAELEKCTDVFDRELLEIDLIDMNTQLASAQNYVNGAIRKMNYFVNQHKNVLEKIGKTEFTEEDYEKEEVRYHIMTAMKQALNSARARGGIIDEGNSIYLFDLGINVADAQAELLSYLNAEQEIIKTGKFPSHTMTIKWLEACANKWCDEPENYAKSRGFSVLDEQSLNVPLTLSNNL